MSYSKWAIAALTVLSLETAWAGGDEWIQDFEAAKAQARSEGKDLLLDFTGSDWCIWCKRLDAEVFSQDPFKSEAPKKFVLVKLDFPRDESLVTPEIKAQNERLQERFGVQGFPTVFLCDAEGLPYAQTGYREGGAAKYMEHLAELRQRKARRDEALAKAQQAEGIERAKLLDNLLSEFEPGVVLGCYGDLVEEIVRLDADGSAGLRAKYGEMRRLAEIDTLLNRHAPKGEWEELGQAMARIAGAEDATPKVRQKALFFQSFSLFRSGDVEGAIKLLDEARTLEGDPQLKEQIEAVRGQLEQVRGLGVGSDDDADDADEDDGDEEGDGGSVDG